MLLAVLAVAGAAGAQRLALSQVVQKDSSPPALRAYLDLLDNSGQAVSIFSSANLQATLGADPLETLSVEPFVDSGEGVAIVFMVDISASLDAQQFAEIRLAIESWLDRLRGIDRAALIAFGSTSRLLVDYTADFARVRNALRELGPTDRDTLFNRALLDALELGERVDGDLPGRRAVVVLTDGRDEGSSIAFDDVLDRVKQDPLPIYTIGHSRLAEPERGRHLDVLKRLSANSGGVFFEARSTAFAEAYSSIDRAISRVWAVDLACARCVADGSARRLQVNVSVGNRVLTEGRDIRLLPPPAGLQPSGAGTDQGTGPATTSVTSEPTADTGVGSSDSAVREGEGAAADGGGGGLGALFAVGLLLVAGAAVVAGLILRARQGKSPPAEPQFLEVGAPATPAPAAPLPHSESSGSVTMSAPTLETPAPSHGSDTGSLPSLTKPGQVAGAGPAGPGQERDVAPPVPPTVLSDLRLAEDAAEEGVVLEPPVGVELGPEDETVEFGLSKEAARAALAERDEPKELDPPLPYLETKGAYTGPIDPLTESEELEVEPRMVRLITVRGDNKSKQYRAVLRRGLVVGSRSTCDLVLAGESSVEPEQFELYQVHGRIYVRDLADQHETLVNGVPLTDRQVVNTGDLLGNSNFIVRVSLDG